MTMRVQTPLSGDVTQAWAWWIRSLSQQTGFININNLRSGDPDLEQRIVEEVASYGRQLGWIMEALDVVIGQLKKDELTTDERIALRQFDDLVQRVDDMKGGSSKSPLTLSSIERVLEGVRALKDEDPAAYKKAVSQIREGLALD